MSRSGPRRSAQYGPRLHWAEPVWVFPTGDIAGEEAQDVFGAADERPTCHDHPAPFHRGEETEIGFEVPHDRFGRQLDEHVAGAAPDEDGIGPQAGEPWHRLGGFHRFGGEVEFNPSPVQGCREEPAVGVEAGRAPRLEAACLPEDVGGGHGGVTAQVLLAAGHEPPEVEPIVALLDEGCHGQVHLVGDGLHPQRVCSGLEQADRRRVPSEGGTREGVDHHDRDGHAGVL